MDEERVHGGGESPGRAGGSGGFTPLSDSLSITYLSPVHLRVNYASDRVFVGNFPREEQQRRGGGGDEGAPAAEQPARVGRSPGRGGGRGKRRVGTIHHQEGGQEHGEGSVGSRDPALVPTALTCPTCPQVDPEELTLIHNLRKLLRNDWVRAATDAAAESLLMFLL